LSYDTTKGFAPTAQGRRWRAVLAGALAAGAFALAACGSDDDSASTEGEAAAPDAAAFPAVDGQTLVEFAKGVGLTNEVVVSPAGQTYEPGRNRFSFGVFNPDRSEVNDAEIALYAAHGPTGVAAGPFPARIESLQTEPAFASETTAAESQPVTVAYVSEMEFDRPGEWRLAAVTRQDGSFEASLLPSIEVGDYERIPDVGEMPPRIHTPTASDVGALSEIDTRIPPDTMHEHDLYDVLGKRPTVLLFATPALCMSRVCGPMVDIAEQVHSETPDDVAFVHMEVYNDNDPSKGIRPELQAYGLQTEPWLFVMDASGKVSTRIEGAFSVGDLEAAVEKARGA
jgi:hypothetical protein